MFDPYHILAELSVSVNLPWPLPDFDAELTLEWGPEPLPPLLPVPLKEISVEHLKVTTTWPLPTAGDAILTLPDADGDGDGFFAGNVPAAPSDTDLGPSDASPVVPLDARPRITFGRPVHDSALVGVNPSVVFPDTAPEAGWEWIGDPSRNEGPARVRSSLSEVALERWTGSRWQAVARKATSSNASGVRSLYGSWAPVPQLPAGNVVAGSPAPTANVKLWLWSKSAFDFSRRTGGAWDEFIDRAYPNYPCIDLPKDHQECIDFSELNEGDVPSAPWHPAAHPEIEISWRVPPAPIVRVVSGHKELCFPKAAEVEVHLGARVKEVTISLDYDGRTETTSCADFREQPEGDGANPRQDGKVRFLVLDRTGRPTPQTRIVAFPLNTGSLRGLDAGFQTTIDIPPSDFVDLDLTRLNQPPRLEAIGAGGTSIDRQAAAGAPRTPQRIHLERKPGQPKIVRVIVTSPADQVALHRVCYSTRARHIVGVAIDRHGRELGSFTDANGVIDVPGRDVVSVRLDADGEPFCLTGICVVIGLDQADRIQREEMLRHMVDELARWQGDDEVLEPWSRYRLKLVTAVEVRDFPHDAAFNTTRTITQCAYFRTEGPPGLAAYSVPIGHPQETAGAPAGTSDPPPFDSGVQDLSRYVQQTVPPTVPPAGEKPPLPRPVYRAYDVGVRFNENYVDEMYRLAGRDLSLALYDNNNQPVRDHLGRLLTTVNRWGRADSVELSASEERWITHVNATTCAQIDSTRISRDVTLDTDAHVLDAGTVYEARLLPLLVHDAFADYAIGAQARGTGARLTPTRGAGWTVRDEGSDQGPSQWVVREAGNPPARYVEQTTNVSNGAAQRATAFAGGTLLVRDDDPRAGIPQADRPANWTDYRLSCFIRSTDDDLVGVGVRWNGRSGYLFTLDREQNRRRLVRLLDGAATILAEAAGGYDVNRDYLVQIEASGDRIRAFVDGVPVFDATDNQFATGGVALYCGQNAGGQFRDVRVDDLRAAAPIVYRFKFTTSEFTDFRHHMHSHLGLTFRAAWPDLNGVAAALGQAVAIGAASQPPAEAEARAYDELAVKALGTDARQTLTRVDVSRVEQGGVAIGLLVRTADPIDWRRTSAALARAQAQTLLPAPANGPRLIRTTFATATAPQANDESVTVLLDSGADVRWLAHPDPQPAERGCARHRRRHGALQRRSGHRPAGERGADRTALAAGTRRSQRVHDPQCAGRHGHRVVGRRRRHPPPGRQLSRDRRSVRTAGTPGHVRRSYRRRLARRPHGGSHPRQRDRSGRRRVPLPGREQPLPVRVRRHAQRARADQPGERRHACALLTGVSIDRGAAVRSRRRGARQPPPRQRGRRSNRGSVRRRSRARLRRVLHVGSPAAAIRSNHRGEPDARAGAVDNSRSRRHPVLLTLAGRAAHDDAGRRHVRVGSDVPPRWNVRAAPPSPAVVAGPTCASSPHSTRPRPVRRDSCSAGWTPTTTTGFSSTTPPVSAV